MNDHIQEQNAKVENFVLATNGIIPMYYTGEPDRPLSSNKANARRMTYNAAASKMQGYPFDRSFRVVKVSPCEVAKS